MYMIFFIPVITRAVGTENLFPNIFYSLVILAKGASHFPLPFLRAIHNKGSSYFTLVRSIRYLCLRIIITHPFSVT